MEHQIHRYPKAIACRMAAGLVAAIGLSFLPLILLPAPEIWPLLCFPTFVLTLTVAALFWLTRHWSTVVVDEDQIECRRWLGRTRRMRFNDITRVVPDGAPRAGSQCDLRVYGEGRKHVIHLSRRLSDYLSLLQQLKQRTPQLTAEPEPRLMYDDPQRPTAVTVAILIVVAALLVYPPGLGEWGKPELLGLLLGMIAVTIDVVEGRHWPWVRREAIFENDRVVVRKNKGEIVYAYADLQSVEIAEETENSFSRYCSVTLVKAGGRSRVVIGRMIPENVAHAMRAKWEAYQNQGSAAV